MAISLHAAERSEALLIENLFQLYYYDFTELLGGHVERDGKFALPPIEPYWQDPWRYPHIVRVDEHPAGFALVHRRSRITQDPDTWDIAEFFIMRQYRRSGLGSFVALQLFDRFRGRWEVRQLRTNAAATCFWRLVVGCHTGGQYTELVYDDERWRGPVQSFDNTMIE